MSLTKMELYNDTITHPTALYYNAPGLPWIYNEFVNDSLDLVFLLHHLLPAPGNAFTVSRSLEFIQDFLIPYEPPLTRQAQLETFSLLRQEAATSVNSHARMFSLKRYAILKMISELPENLFEPIKKLITTAAETSNFSQEDYTYGVAALCCALKLHLAKINRITSLVEPHIPVDILNALGNLTTQLKATQRKYAYYDHPKGSYGTGITQSLIARGQISAATLAATLGVGFFIAGAVEAQWAFAFASAVMTLVVAYICLDIVQSLYELHIKCESEHDEYKRETRNKLGLPQATLPLPPVNVPGPVERFFSFARSFIREDRNRYNPLTRSATQELIENPSSGNGSGNDVRLF